MFSLIVKKHLASQKKNKIILSSLLAITAISAFTACKIDIRNFLKENTEIAAVDKCLNESDLKPYEITDPNGNYVYCIPSSNDLVIRFRLRNPQNYELIPSKPETYRETAEGVYQTGDPSITVSFDTLGKDYIGTYDPPLVLTKKPTNSNQAYDALFEIDDDCYYLTLTYTRDFLLKTEMGHNISPTILLRHPRTKNDFESYSELHIACNSPPPAVSGPIVYQDESKYPNQYILLFNMPQTDDLKGIHNDIKHLYIKTDGDGKGNAPFDYDYQVEVNETGAFTLSGSAPTPTIGKDAVNEKLKNNYITPTGAVFTAGENPVYIPLDHKLSYNEILYAFTIADSWNLKSAQTEASISSKKLSDPYFTDSKNTLILDEAGIPQDKNSSYATFNFIPALLTYWFEDKSTGLVQNKYYVDESNEGNSVSVPKNFVFDETKINEQTSSVETIAALQQFLTDTLPADAYLKENKNGIINKIPLENKLSEWVIQHANTSKCTIEYSVSQILDSGETSQLFSGHFDSAESSGTSPQKQNNKLLTSGNTLRTDGHYTSVELPGGKLLVTVYAHKTGYADSNPVEYRFEVLRTRVYVSDKTDSNDTKNNGSANSHFKTITNAANRLSIRTDTTNTIYLDTDIEEDIEIPAAEENDKPSTSIDETKPLYVTIKPTEGTRTITAKNETDEDGNIKPLLNIPDNSTVILENLILKDGNIKVGENAKLYLNNVTFTGDNTDPINKIIVAPTGIVILGGKTNIGSTFIGKDEDLNDIYQNIIELEERIDEVTNEIGEKEYVPRCGKVQLGTTTPSRKYEPQGNLVVLQTEKEHPRLNNILLEIDNGKPLKNEDDYDYNIFYLDLTKEDESQAYQLFRLNNSGYYIGYDDIYKPDSKTYGRGLVKIPAAEITEPSVGGFEANLKTSSGSVLTPTSSNEYNGNLYIITKGANITYSISDSNSEAINKELSLKLFTNLKMELYLEGQLIQKSSNPTEPVIDIPITYPEGYYSISVYFTFNDITYCEQFNVYLKEGV